MGRAYIYMQLPDSDEVVTLGRLEIVNGVGEFAYSPEFVERQGWVPDSFHYPLRSEFHTGITTNAGIPGFIRDATPDGWGQRVMAKVAGAELSAIEYLLKSTNQDRSGTLMVGSTRQPPKGVGQSGIGDITTLEDFIAFADGVQGHSPRPINAPARQAARQRSSLGGARPKCTLRHESRLILAKPRDRHDDFDVPSVGNEGALISRTNLLSHAEHFGLDREGAESILNEVAGWEDELRGHYEQQLSEPERGLAIAAIGAQRMRA